ncbi:MAG TPA: hypothetical protein VGI07_03185 [Solirubrobacteraceae bacterium]|jgi:hypothetical protein
MKMHANARLSLKGRELLVDRVEGVDGLLDRSSAPVLVANRTEEHRLEVIAALRRLRTEIVESLDTALSTCRES